jgi:GT2 family glycosyltransferase
MVTATVVICTHDRADVLPRAVEAALGEARAADADVLVVDNASTDGTPAVLDGLRREAGERLRVVTEPVLGLSAARNRALAEASGAVTAFLDDDAVPRPGWLAALLAPYDDTRVACVGGRVVLRFPDAPPPWLVRELHPALSAYDLGDAPRAVRYGSADYPYGANISFRVAAARAAGGFSTRMGLRGTRQLQHEEIDLCYRLEAAGGEVRYAPDAVVDHWIAAERLTPDWLLNRHWHGGQSAAAFILRNRGVARALWRVWWLYKRPLVARPYAARPPVDGARLAAECRRREALGYLLGLARGMAGRGMAVR